MDFCFFQKAFEGISDNFKNPLTEEQRQAIEEILNKLPVEQIDILVELIFECIVLKIDVPQNKDDEDYVDMCDNRYTLFFKKKKNEIVEFRVCIDNN